MSPEFSLSDPSHKFLCYGKRQMPCSIEGKIPWGFMRLTGFLCHVPTQLPFVDLTTIFHQQRGDVLRERHRSDVTLTT